MTTDNLQSKDVKPEAQCCDTVEPETNISLWVELKDGGCLIEYNILKKQYRLV